MKDAGSFEKLAAFFLFLGKYNESCLIEGVVIRHFIFYDENGIIKAVFNR
jgi:hypothetical protein